MKNMLRALRRHHAERLKKARRFYHGRDLSYEPRTLGFVLHTPQVCSCWMCGNQRKHAGRTRAELRHFVNFVEEVS